MDEISDEQYREMARRNFKVFFSLFLLTIAVLGLIACGFIYGWGSNAIFYASGLVALVILAGFILKALFMDSTTDAARVTQSTYSETFRKKYNGQLVNNISDVSNILQNNLWTIIGTYEGITYSVEAIRRFGRIDVRFSAECKAQFEGVITYIGNLDPASDVLKTILVMGGQRYKEFWVKGDKLNLAKAFCEQNYQELKKLMVPETRRDSFLDVGKNRERMGVEVKGGKISMFSGMSGKGPEEEFETLISIAKKYR